MVMMKYHHKGLIQMQRKAMVLVVRTIQLQRKSVELVLKTVQVLMKTM